MYENSIEQGIRPLSQMKLPTIAILDNSMFYRVEEQLEPFHELFKESYSLFLRSNHNRTVHRICSWVFRIA
jgi:hypothetical protein